MNEDVAMISRAKIFLPLVVLILAGAGCVRLRDNLQVSAPNQVDLYQRNVLDKCEPHVYPHRLILAQAGTGSQLLQVGGQMVNNQIDFDRWWNSVTPQLDATNSSIDALKPTVNWELQQVFFLPISVSSSCHKVRSYGDEMTTDCYSITVPIIQSFEGQNCQPALSHPVLIYIFPKTTLPVTAQWVTPTPTPGPVATAVPPPTPTPIPAGTMAPKGNP
jgi:hypothetical protein